MHFYNCLNFEWPAAGGGWLVGWADTEQSGWVVRLGWAGDWLDWDGLGSLGWAGLHPFSFYFVNV